jgi:hypothetical protein
LIGIKNAAGPILRSLNISRVDCPVQDEPNGADLFPRSKRGKNFLIFSSAR